MKKVLTFIVAACAAVAFASIVSAAEPIKTQSKSEAPAAGEVKKEEANKPAKKAKKAKKAHKASKKEAAPALPAGHPPIGNH